MFSSDTKIISLKNYWRSKCGITISYLILTTLTILPLPKENNKPLFFGILFRYTPPLHAISVVIRGDKKEKKL